MGWVGAAAGGQRLVLQWDPQQQLSVAVLIAHLPSMMCRAAAPTLRTLPPQRQETVRFTFGGGTYSLGQLLPMRFKPADLLPAPAPPLLLQPQNNAIQLTGAARAALRERGGDAAFARAAAEALAEATGSYAPYSRCPAGAAIVTGEGHVYSGGYIESAAYNPSLPPLQTAIVDAVIGGWGWRRGADGQHRMQPRVQTGIVCITCCL